jgi:hypothetical protein
MHLHSCVALLPYVRICLKALRKKPFDFEPQTLGERIKKKETRAGAYPEGGREEAGGYVVYCFELGEGEDGAAGGVHGENYGFSLGQLIGIQRFGIPA